jgi:rubrerythrin
MSYDPIRRIMNRSKEIHEGIRGFYERLSDQTEKKRVRMLLEYLKEHQKELENTLEDLKGQASQDVLDAWLQYRPEPSVEQMLPDMEFKPEMSVDELVQAALSIDDALITYYRRIAENTEFQEVKEVFASLAEKIENDKTKLALDSAALKQL